MVEGGGEGGLATLIPFECQEVTFEPRAIGSQKCGGSLIAPTTPMQPSYMIE
jgi:hypothetical protein